jgi:hypothetical protein
MTASPAPLVTPWRIAREYSRRAREAARALDHPLSLAYALTMSAAVAQGLDDVEATHEFASEAIALSARNAFAYWRAWATTLQGWTMTRKGRIEAGLDTMLAGLRPTRKPVPSSSSPTC